MKTLRELAIEELHNKANQEKPSNPKLDTDYLDSLSQKDTTLDELFNN